MIVFSFDALTDIERVRHFLETRNPEAAVRAIWIALERVEDSPQIGHPTKVRDIRQIFIRFGRRGYIVRYKILPPDDTIFVTRIWHGREARD